MGNTCQTSLHKCYSICDCEDLPPFTFPTQHECSLSFHSNNTHNTNSINPYTNNEMLSNNVSSISIQNYEDDIDNNNSNYSILTSHIASSPYKTNNSVDIDINLSSFIANFITETNYTNESISTPLSPQFYSVPIANRSHNNANDITSYTEHNNKDSSVLKKILLIQSTFKSFLISKRENEYNLLKNKKSISTSQISASPPKTSLFLSYLKSNYTIQYPPHCNRHSKGGICKLVWEDNSWLLAFYVNNKLNGVGIFHIKNTAVYKGSFKQNLFNGYGVYITSDKTKIEGVWCKGKLNGFAVEQFSDGTVYQGEYANSLRNGTGMYKHSSGWVYEGEFRNNKMEGMGRISYDDRYYQGEFKGGVFEGYGEFHWKKGYKYVGFWRKGMKNVFGVYTDIKKRQAYVGFWKDNKMEGVGVIYDESGEKFGKWKDGVKVVSYENYGDAVKEIVEKRDKVFIPFFFKSREEAAVLFY